MNRKIKISVFLLITITLVYVSIIDDEKFEDNISERMIREENYPVETHIVETDDGYFLTVYRIPGPSGSVPVYLQHGLLSSSVDWLKNGKSRSLAYFLSDYGFDVWIGNARGNIYSKKHKKWSTLDPEFWNFSWHELGYYDIPAVVTYISKTTNSSMFYVGHSMGCTTFSVTAIERPNIAKHIKAMVALAPAIYEYHMKQSLIRLIANNLPTFQNIANFFEINQFLQPNKFFKVLSRFCNVPFIGRATCSNYIFYLMGYNAEQLDYKKLSTYIDKVPAGTSLKLLFHWLQQININKFNYFDYGPDVNLKIYNSSEPPKYDLMKIQVPIAVFFSENDIITTSEDVRHFYDQVPHKIGLYDVGHSFNHIDFLWGINATELIYHKILDIFKSKQFHF